MASHCFNLNVSDDVMMWSIFHMIISFLMTISLDR